MNKLLLLVSCLLFATAFALTQSEQQQIVSQHNHIRSNVSPVPVQALKNLRYSAALEKEAVKVASQCSNAASTGRISGENLFFAHGDRSDNVETLLTSAVASWEAEKAHFTLTASKAVCEEGQECEHYTQMIWESTSEIGCDFQVCQNNSPWGDAYPTWTVFVCHYSSRGNTLNQLPYENTNESPLASRSSIDYANDFVQTIPQQTHDFVSSSNQVTLFAHGEHVLRWESSSALIDPTATTQVQTIAEIGKGSFGVVLRHGQGADRENDGIYWIVNRVGRATSQLQLCMRTFGEVTCDEERSVRFPSSSVLVTVQMAHNPIDNTLFTSFQIGEQQAWTAYVSSEMFPYTGAIAFIMTPPESTTNPSISAITLSTVAKVSISLNQCLNEFQLSELFSELHSGSSLVQWTPQNDDCRMVELTIVSDFASALAKAREFVSSPLSSDIIFAQVVEDDAFANVEKDILIGSRWYQSSLFFTTHTKVEYIVASPESTTSTGSGLGAGSIAAIVLGSVLGGVFCCCLLLVLLLLLCLAAALARGKREVTPVVPVTQAVPVVAVQAVGSNAAGAHSNVAGRAAGSPAANGSNHYEYH